MLSFRSILKMISVVTIIISISSISSFSSSTAESACSLEAGRWISELHSPKEKILQDHCRENCRFASIWVKKSSDVLELKKRERTCNDLVLIWSHKECIYFRDYVDESAYYPCKAWTREMFRQCIAGNASWFLAE